MSLSSVDQTLLVSEHHGEWSVASLAPPWTNVAAGFKDKDQAIQAALDFAQEQSLCRILLVPAEGPPEILYNQVDQDITLPGSRAL